MGVGEMAPIRQLHSNLEGASLNKTHPRVQSDFFHSKQGAIVDYNYFVTAP